MPYLLNRIQLDDLLAEVGRTRTTYGPTVRDGAIRYGAISSTADLPVGWSDEQQPGRYHIHHEAGAGALFDYAVGPDSLKQSFFPPRVSLVSCRRTPDGMEFDQPDHQTEPVAFVGVRPCELAAIDTQDAVLAGGPYHDPSYAARRSDVLIVAVDCGSPASSCFCTTFGTGPRADAGFDIAITEIEHEGSFSYVCRPGSDRGERLLSDAPSAGQEDLDAADATIRQALDAMPARFDPDEVRLRLATDSRALAWTAIEERCLACANCTLVCPTCFCTTVVDRTDLDVARWDRERVWDSCFSADFSALHRRPVRGSVGSRYRQWLTHKLSTWYDQFGSSGCVGCGRCITWCPVGIDLVVEAARVGETVGASP